MTPAIKLSKQIIQDDPRNLVCYVTLTAVETTGIPNNIFIVKYIPPTSPSDPGSRTFYNVAYVDQLSDVPRNPEDKYKPGFISTHTVTKSFANNAAAERWCIEIYKEIQRLLSTYALQATSGLSTEVTITEHTYSESDAIDADTVNNVSIDDEPADGFTDGIEDAESVSDVEVVDLTYDGKEITI